MYLAGRLPARAGIASAERLLARWRACAKATLLGGVALTLAVALATGGIAQGRSGPERVPLRGDPDTMLAYVAASMRVKLRPDVPPPAIRLASNTSLARFQKAIGSQWGFQPRIIVNAYAVATNEIYLDDSADYYRRTRRTLDDSLVHELVHYVQVRYRQDDLADESCEMEAVTIQTAYRYRQSPDAATPRASGRTAG